MPAPRHGLFARCCAGRQRQPRQPGLASPAPKRRQPGRHALETGAFTGGLQLHTQPLIQPVNLRIDAAADWKLSRGKSPQFIQQREQFGMQHDAAFRRDDLWSLTLIETGGNTIGQSFQMKGGAPPAMQRHGPEWAHLFRPDIGALEKGCHLRLFPNADFRFLPMLELAAAAGRKGLTGRRAPRCCRFDQFDHPGADALRVQAQRLRQNAFARQAGRNKDNVPAVLMIMLVAGCADAVAPPADMADRHLNGGGVSRQLASLAGGAAAAAAGPLLFFKAVLSILLAMAPCRALSS